MTQTNKNSAMELLMDDGFDLEPPKRILHYMEAQKKKGKPILGIYCGFAPMEVIRAMGIVPAILCAFSKVPISSAETVLPGNLCPLIKSSYGFILEGTCPFFTLSEAIIGETTCDGKKKMFELAAEVKPMHVMDLPQLPDETEAVDNWAVMIQKLQHFLEQTFAKKATKDQVEAAIKDTNRKNHLMQEFYSYAALHPPVINWEEMYDVGSLAMPASADELEPVVKKVVKKLKNRVAKGQYYGTAKSPRVLVSGCPVGRDALKIFKIIEACGGLVVVPDACSGIKAFIGDIKEDTGNPIRAIAKKYLAVPCACMSPNQGRLTALSEMIERFKPDVVIDFILTACHSYNVESYKIGQHVAEAHNLPFLKIETDYSDNDDGQIRTKIEALFEMVLG